MEFVIPGPDLATELLRAMLAVARVAEGGLSHTHRVIIDTAQRLALDSNVRIDELENISPAALAERLSDRPQLSRQLVRGMLLMSMAEGVPTPAQIELIQGFSAALKVDEPATRTIEHAAKRETLLFRLDMVRRGPTGSIFAEEYRAHGGLLAVAKGVLGIAGIHEEPKLAARFHALAKLPQNTVGYALHRFYTVNGFAFPGEKGGFPLAGIFHDTTHILAGYDPSHEGEMLTGAIQAGYRGGDDSFYNLLSVVAIHSAGIKIVPIVTPTKVLGRIGQGDLSDQLLVALRRGNAMNKDLSVDWDPWPVFEQPLQQARESLGIPPLVERPRVGALDLGIEGL